MSEKALQQQTTALVANSTVSLTWTGNDFQRAFSESVIKKPIALRLTASTTAVGNGVFIGVSYTTLSKTYQLAERLTIGTIPAGGSVELTAASIPAMGRLFQDIVSITITFTSPVGGNVSATLIVDDDPPPLSADLGERVGLDAAVSENAVIISAFGNPFIPSGTIGNALLWYTVPVGKRLYIDLLSVSIEATGSYPADGRVLLQLTIAGVPCYVYLFSETERWPTTFLPPIAAALVEGDSISTLEYNYSATGIYYSFSFIGREVF